MRYRTTDDGPWMTGEAVAATGRAEEEMGVASAGNGTNGTSYSRTVSRRPHPTSLFSQASLSLSLSDRCSPSEMALSPAASTLLCA